MAVQVLLDVEVVAQPWADQSMAELLDRQARVLTRAQANTHGISDDAIAARVAARRWQRVRPGCYAVFTGPLPRLSHLWAALLYAGPEAILCGPTAAEVDGLIDRPRDPNIHLCLPANRRVRPQPGLRIHRSRRHAMIARPAAHPPRTRIEHTVLHLVSKALTADEAIAVIANACQRRLTTAGRLAAAVESHGSLRWRSVALAALRDVADGAQSLLEIRYLRDVERKHGLPTGRRQRALRRAGHREWIDVSYDEFATRVELDGRLGHDQVTEVWRDMRRDNRAAVAGEVSLRYGWADVTGRRCAVAGEVAKVLQSRGWPGKPRRCGNSCGL